MYNFKFSVTILESDGITFTNMLITTYAASFIAALDNVKGSVGKKHVISLMGMIV